MSKLSLIPGTTSQILHVFIYDSTATDGSGKTALAFGDITAYYVRAGGTLTALTMETIATLGTWASSGDNYLGFKLLDDTNAPGLYELHLPNNILAAGSNQVVIQLRATGAAPCNIEVQLANVPSDLQKWIGVIPLALSSQQVQAIVPVTQKVDVETIKTQTVTCGAGVTVGPYVGNATAAIAVNGSGYVTYTNAAPLNSTATQAAAAAALTAYGPPTNAQMEARTLVAANYATAENQTTIIEDTGTTLPALISAINVTVTPLSSTVSAGQVTDGAMTLYQNQAIYNVIIVVTDSDDNAVNCTGLGLAFCVYAKGYPSTILWSLTSGASELTVGGSSNNQITLSDDDSHTGTAGIYRYVLWDTTNDRVLARGELTIEEEADSA